MSKGNSHSISYEDMLILHNENEVIKEKVQETITKEQGDTTDLTDVVFTPFEMPLSKRIFDIVISSFLLITLSPLLLLVMILIKLESEGPIFYISQRVGTGYKVFDFYKFRSMRVNADKMLDKLSHLNQYNKVNKRKDSSHTEKSRNFSIEYFDEEKDLLVADNLIIDETVHIKKSKDELTNSFVKIKNDPRITKIGYFIRNSSIDELPQLINVLKGDMSIVGNRPLPLYEAEKLTSDEWAMRFIAPAGITGWWQVKDRGTEDISEDKRKQLDVEYAMNYSIWLDIKIIFMTIPALFQKVNS